LDEIGLGGERVHMFNLSAAMGARLAEIATEMTEKVKALGPNPLGPRNKEQAARGDNRTASSG
jgi:coenzyme F420-reducing hydrogenase delta subunit